MKTAERGSVLFYILIAVALLAALSFAIIQSTRGNVQQLTAERARLYATELIEYANNITAAVAQVRLRGTALENLCFDDQNWPGGVDYSQAGCGDTRNKIYDTDGGGVIWSELPQEILVTGATDRLWHFYADNEIKNIGTTCAAANCTDLILVADELDKTVCVQLNGLLGIGTEGADPPTDAGLGTTLYQGSFSYTATIGEEPGGVALDGQPAGCFEKTGAGARYVYYKVLIAR